MDKTIDARGQACPLPVILAKKELSANADIRLRVLVDNEIATENLMKLAENTGCTCERIMPVQGNEYEVIIAKGTDTAGVPAKTSGNADGKRAAVVCASDKMGEGAGELGAALMKSFIYSLTQNEKKPAIMVFYNSGAYLTCDGSASLMDLKMLSGAGVEILTCGACLNFYSLGKPAVGEISNMFVISEKLLEADLVIRP